VPVLASTAVALSSPQRTVEGLIRAAEASQTDWGPLTAINLPALTTTVQDMANALGRVAGTSATALLDWQYDANTSRIVTSWPSRIASPRAQGLGLHADADFEHIVRAYVAGNPQSVKLSTRN
jgi:D-erythronate 2-dehydrogenase